MAGCALERRFVQMKKIISFFPVVLSVLLISGFTVSAGETQIHLDRLETRKGEVYTDVTVVAVHDNGIDIGYINADGVYCLKGLKFSILPEDLQKRFNYQPEKAASVDKKLKDFESLDVAELTDSERQRLEAIGKVLRQKAAGDKTEINLEDLRFAIYARRSSIRLTVLDQVKTGSAVRVDKVIDGAPIKSDVIIIDDVDLPDDGEWSGFVYPTGLKAVYKGKKDIPVFTESLKRATELVGHYLEIYSAYSREKTSGGGDEQKETLPPDLSEQSEKDSEISAATPAEETASAETAAESGSKDTEKLSSGLNYVDNGVPIYGSDNGVYYYGGYYIGGSWGPVWWWWHRYPPRPPRPPKPRPPRPWPPKPSKPDRIPQHILRPQGNPQPQVKPQPRPGMQIRPRPSTETGKKPATGTPAINKTGTVTVNKSGTFSSANRPAGSGNSISSGSMSRPSSGIVYPSGSRSGRTIRGNANTGIIYSSNSIKRGNVSSWNTSSGTHTIYNRGNFGRAVPRSSGTTAMPRGGTIMRR